MRIPKYRVYIKHWGDLNDEFVCIKEGELHIYFRNWEQNMYESAIFQQFTGVKDSKGVDIYEGDLIESPYDRIPFVVEYVTDSVGSQFILAPQNDEDEGYTLPIDNDYTVVGNIFDNMLGARLRMDKRLAGREKPNLDEVEFGAPHLKEN